MENSQSILTFNLVVFHITLVTMDQFWDITVSDADMNRVMDEHIDDMNVISEMNPIVIHDTDSETDDGK